MHHLARAAVAAAMLAVASTSHAEGVTLSSESTTLLTVSRQLSSHATLQGTYERTLKFLGPTDGAVEDGRSDLYGHLYLYGDSAHVRFGMGPSVALHSAFASPAENRHFHISLADPHNVPGTERTDLVLHSWSGDYTSHVTHMVLKADGRVGIGTIAPAYPLEVGGAVAATSFVNLSSRKFKEQIRELGPEAQAAMLETLVEVPIASYRYKKEAGGTGESRIGFIAEELPREVLSGDGRAVDVYELLTYTIGAMKEQQRRIVELERKLAAQPAAAVVE